MKQKNVIIVLLLLTVIGCFLRVWQLNQIPNGLNRDEAALGYNALLLSKTGTDEWGKHWPITLQSFGDYKLIGSAWLMIPLISFLGVSDWAVRLPAALAGTALIPLSYLLARAIRLRASASVLAAVLVTFSGVFFFFSRFGFEAIIALAALTASLIFFLRPKSGKYAYLYLILGTLFFGFSCLTYNTPLLLTPVVIFIIAASYGLLSWKKWIIPVAAVLSVAVILLFLTSSSTGQKAAITVFSDPSTLAEYPQYRTQFSGPVQMIVGNKYIFISQKILYRYIQFFTPNFLVIKGGGHPWHQLPGFSHFSWLMYFLVIASVIGSIVGIIKNWRHFIEKPSYFLPLIQSNTGRSTLLLASVAVSLVLPSMTIDAPHATRSLFVFLLLYLVVANYFEIITIWLIQKKRSAQFLLPVLIVCIVLFQLPYYFNYFKSYSAASRVILQSGISEALATAPDGKIQVVDPDGYEYVRYAWYSHLSPTDFFSTFIRRKANAAGLQTGSAVGNLEFTESVPIEATYPLYQWKDANWKRER